MFTLPRSPHFLFQPITPLLLLPPLLCRYTTFSFHSLTPRSNLKRCIVASPFSLYALTAPEWRTPTRRNRGERAEASGRVRQRGRREGEKLIVALRGRKDEGRTEVGREAGGFSTKLRLKVFKECQRGTLYPFSSATHCLPLLHPSPPDPHLFLPLRLTTLSR